MFVARHISMTWLNTQDRCRICAHLPSQKIRLIQVLSVEGDQQNLRPKLFHCFKITINEQDTLPTSVCELCISRLDSYFSLVKDYYHGQRYLRELHHTSQQINIMIQQTEIKSEPLDSPKTSPKPESMCVEIKSEDENSRLPEILPPVQQLEPAPSESSASASVDERNLPSSSGIPSKILKNTKIITCEFCDKKFTHRGDFNKHLRKHTGEQPYSCEVCQKKFAHTSNLNRHKLVHTGDLPFECDKCHKKFNRKDKLATHKRCREPTTPTTS